MKKPKLPHFSPGQLTATQLTTARGGVAVQPEPPQPAHPQLIAIEQAMAIKEAG